MVADTPAWLLLFGGVGGGLISGLLGPLYLSWRRRPVLELVCEPSKEEYVRRTTLSYGSAETEGIYLRVGIRNKKNVIARSASCFLVAVERYNEAGTPRQTSFVDSTPLCIAARLTESGKRVIETPLFRSVTTFVDVLCTLRGYDFRDDSTITVIPGFQPDQMKLVWPTHEPLPYRDLFLEPGAWRITIRAVADEAVAAVCQLKVSWSGTWDSLTVQNVTPAPTFVQLVRRWLRMQYA
jgi:hypothetical protein